MAEITGTDIVRGAYRLMGRPSQSDIRYQDVVDNAHDVVNGHLLDMKMSNRNHTAIIGPWRTPVAITENTQLYATETEDFFIPVKAEWRYVNGAATQTPQPVEFCALESIDNLRDVPMDYVALYDNNSKIRFGDLLTVLANREYRLIYESLDLAEFKVIGSSIENFPAAFIAMCSYETAEISIHQVRNETESWMMRKDGLLKTIEPMRMVWNERFDRWQNQRFGNRKTYKVGYRAPGRY